MISGAADPVARRAALVAFGAIVALGLASMILRLIGLQAIVPFTLRIMSDLARDAFMRVQRFSTDWHANAFAGSTVRKVTRGMWAVDLLNDTILMALLPSLLVLLGSMVLLGLHWPSLGTVVLCGRCGGLRSDGGDILDAVTSRPPRAHLQCLGHQGRRYAGGCLDVQRWSKSFGAELREDARTAKRVISRWRVRVYGGHGCATTIRRCGAAHGAVVPARASVIRGGAVLACGSPAARRPAMSPMC